MRIELGVIGLLAIASSAFGQMQAPVQPDKLPPIQQPGANGYDGKKVIELAEAELGTFKIPGQDDNRVKQYCTETMQNDDVYSQDGWCSAFVSFILREAGYKFSPNNTDFGWMYVCHRVAEPQLGDIAMLDSHIAFFLGKKVNAEGIHVVGLLGGNQDYQVCVMWVPDSDIEYYAEADTAPQGWLPAKHIPNGSSAAGINVLDDRLHWTSPNVFTQWRTRK
jgi:uncharacterized protein (TIGR02594 family)